MPSHTDASASRRLWLFPPGHLHGWTGPPDVAATVAVAHFDHVDEPLASLARRNEYIAVDLTREDVKQIERWFDPLRRDYAHRTAVSALRFQHLRLSLTLLVLDRFALDRAQPLTTSAAIVSRALGWYGEHMADRPSVEDVAEAVGCSAGHLRRVFAQVGHGSPLVAMRRIQIDRAAALLHHSDLSLARIAHTCGFSSPSVFSRAFRAVRGRSPSTLRQRRRANR